MSALYHVGETELWRILSLIRFAVWRVSLEASVGAGPTSERLEAGKSRRRLVACQVRDVEAAAKRDGGGAGPKAHIGGRLDKNLMVGECVW